MFTAAKTEEIFIYLLLKLLKNLKYSWKVTTMLSL